MKSSLLGIDIPTSVCDDASVDVPFSSTGSNGSSTVVAAALSPESLICHPRDIPLLIETIKKDLSELGFRNATVCGRVFPGLVAETLEVLRGQRIALLGDSTLAYFTHWLTFFLDHNRFHMFDPVSNNDPQNECLRDLPKPPNRPRLYEEMNLDQAMGVARCRVEKTCNATPCDNYEEGPSILTLKDGTELMYGGMNLFDDHKRTEEKLTTMWIQAREFRPTIMVVNMGIHWLHFYGIARNVSAEGIKRWILYENFLEVVYQNAVSMNATALLYKTTNFICDEQLYENFLHSHKLYTNNDHETLQACQEEIVGLDQSWFSKRLSDVQDYCRKGTINNHGSLHLNQRLRVFVEQKKNRATKDSNNGLIVDIFDDNSIQGCAYCDKYDGLHFHTLNPIRTRILANQLSCLLQS